VFLRLIEYQSGVIFLTTNRIDDFDTAFHSRIHITISFPKIEQSKRGAIWKNFAQSARGCALSDESCEELASLSLSGRNVKNIIRAATLSAKGSTWGIADIAKVLPFCLSELRMDKETRKQALDFVERHTIGEEGS